MIQERENNTTDDIILSLRYALRSKKQAIAFMNELNIISIEYVSYPPTKRNNYCYIIIIDNLEVKNINGKNLKILNEKYGFDENTFDFFLGITSTYQLGGFTVPQKVVELIRMLGGKLEISYMVT